MAKQVGLAVGPRNLARDQWNSYLDALRKLADLADQRGDYETAINELRQYQEDRGPAALWKRTASSPISTASSPRRLAKTRRCSTPSS